MISPGVFIPVAEESGLIVELSRWALDESCKAVKQLDAFSDGGAPLFISVNFSVHDFSDRDFLHHVTAIMEKNGTAPEHIHLEITESLLMEKPHVAKEALEKCRNYGFEISIDDFGTGYSSLSYLHSFPIDTLKIDQSFIRNVATDRDDAAIVSAITAGALPVAEAAARLVDRHAGAGRGAIAHNSGANPGLFAPSFLEGGLGWMLRRGSDAGSFAVCFAPGVSPPPSRAKGEAMLAEELNLSG